jgi:hypothetical protein
MWRKYLRLIPKVFLIDAYEVSCRARADKVAPRRMAIRPKDWVPRSLNCQGLGKKYVKLKSTPFF